MAVWVGCLWATINALHLIFWANGHPQPLVLYALPMGVLLYQSLVRRHLGLGLLLCVLIIFVAITLNHPVTEWDARSIWMFHAKRIFLGQSLYTQLDNYAPWSHGDYPVGVPAIAASLAANLGHWNEIVPRSAAAIALAPPLFFGAYFFRSFWSICAWVALLMLVCWDEMLTGYMDTLVAANFAIALLAVTGIYRTRFTATHGPSTSPLWWVLSFSLLGLFFTKNEGMVASLLVMMSLLPVVFGQPRKTVFLLWPLLLYGVIWKWPVMRSSVATDLVQQSGLLQRGWSRLSHADDVFMILYFFKESSLAYLGIFAALLAVAALWRQRCGAWLPALLCVAAYTGSLFVAFLTTYHELHWHLTTAADRVFMAFNVATVALLLYLIESRSSRLLGTR